MDKVFDIFDQFATNPALELDGVWVDIGPAKIVDGEPVPDSAPAILVARSGNKRHGRIVSKLYEGSKTLLEGKDDAADAKGEEITIESMGKSILMGWRNIAFKGEVLKDGYDLATAKRLLEVKDFRDLVMRHANNFTKYKIAQDKEDAKN